MSDENKKNEYYGTPEIVAKIAEESNHPSVREKWEELNTLVHLVHKEKVIDKKQKAHDLSKTWEEIDHRIRLVRNATKGTGIDISVNTEPDYVQGYSPGVSYSFTNDDGTMGSISLGHGDLDSGIQLDLPIDDERKDD
tara:strand:+ start:474 stop:887 length:414 start_codon:yes stop_codon:yes gene_type:complete